MRRIALATAVSVAMVTGGLVTAAPASAAPSPDSAGTDFWLGYISNFSGGGELTLFVAGTTATTGTVAVPGLAFSAPFSVTPGSVTSVVVPPEAEMTIGAGVENKGIHVTAGAEVTVYGLNRIQYTTDAFLGLPVDVLGTDYILLGSPPAAGASEGGFVATADGTTVTVTPSADLDTGEPAGVPFAVALNQGQTYELTSSAGDVSGTIVTSNKAISVYGGNSCANIPAGYSACDHIVEQMPPTTAWGKSFVTVPLATRLNGDTFRMVASTNATVVKVNGATVATLNRGQVHEQIVVGAAQISADKPILLAQYSNGSSYDSVTSDPFEMLVPPTEQFLPSYTVSTPATGFGINYINVVAPTSAVGSVLLDGAATPAGSFAPIAGTTFSGAQLSVGLGSHTVSAALPVGVFTYGYADYDSYGYPGGASFAPVATVSSLTLAPPTETLSVGSNGCVTATVKDSTNAAVVGVRVDFAAGTSNTASGFAFTDAAGTAPFCYTGANAGTDTITATLGSLTATATKTWTSVTTNHPPTITGGSGTVVYSDAITPFSITYGDADASDTLTVSATGLPAGLTLTDNQNGTATVSGTDTAAPGSYPVTYRVNDGHGPDVTATGTITVQKETCVLTQPATIMSVATGMTSLTANFGENDTSFGARSGKVVTFTVRNNANVVVASPTASAAANGDLTASVALTEGVYSYTTSFAGDSSYLACATPAGADTIVTVAPAAFKVTGGGWISNTVGRTSFGFNAKSDVGGFHGQLQIRNAKRSFHGNVVLTLSGSGNTATWTGTGKWNGIPGHRFAVTVVDNGTSGKKGDTISIVITSPNGTTTVFTSGGAQLLRGGNIVVH
ncbi:post-COAP-1 domain-containing protein [Oryzobacter telluris]|uniref:post-COAP-1 domain-containing protein n=1 Tax=Oryzobacter telluris TaxID=3149179 RepID=UPI00370D2187